MPWFASSYRFSLGTLLTRCSSQGAVELKFYILRILAYLISSGLKLKQRIYHSSNPLVFIRGPYVLPQLEAFFPRSCFCRVLCSCLVFFRVFSGVLGAIKKWIFRHLSLSLLIRLLLGPFSAFTSDRIVTGLPPVLLVELFSFIVLSGFFPLFESVRGVFPWEKGGSGFGSWGTCYFGNYV